MKKLLATICFLGLAGFVVGVGVFAGDNADIGFSVTPAEISIISIAIEQNWVDYGTMGLSEEKVSPMNRIWADGNKNVSLLIRGDDMSYNWGCDGDPNCHEIGWLLGHSPDVDQYAHQGYLFGYYPPVGVAYPPESGTWPTGAIEEGGNGWTENGITPIRKDPTSFEPYDGHVGGIVLQGGDHYFAFKMFAPHENTFGAQSMQSSVIITAIECPDCWWHNPNP